MKELPNRKLNRLKGFDYSSNGGYFLTFCVKNRIKCFGEILNGKMILNELGKIVENEIYNTAKIRTNIEIDEFIIMPDHVHLILFVGNDCIVPSTNGPMQLVPTNVPINGPMQLVPTNVPINGPMQLVPTNVPINGPMQLVPTNVPINGPMQLVPTVMKGLKSTITKQINSIQNDFLFLWQKSYYDRIIRNEDELNRIRKYIIENPLKWEKEKNQKENIFM